MFLYIGKAVNIRNRVNKHSKQRSSIDIKSGKGISHKLINKVAWLLIEDEGTRDIIETAYLNSVPTAFNIDKITNPNLILTPPADPELNDPNLKSKIDLYNSKVRQEMERIWRREKAFNAFLDSAAYDEDKFR